MNITTEKYNEFKELCKPLIQYLNENHHPHTKIIISTTDYELVEGLMAGEVMDFIRD